MTVEELHTAIAPTAGKVAEDIGQNEEMVKDVITEMVEAGYVGIADDGTVAPLKPLPEK
mgnify:CR=1 FL=1